MQVFVVVPDPCIYLTPKNSEDRRFLPSHAALPGTDADVIQALDDPLARQAVFVHPMVHLSDNRGFIGKDFQMSRLASRLLCDVSEAVWGKCTDVLFANLHLVSPSSSRAVRDQFSFKLR